MTDFVCVCVCVCVPGGEAVLYDGWCGATLHQGRHSPSLLQALLEPAHGSRQKELQTGTHSVERGLEEGWGCIQIYIIEDTPSPAALFIIPLPLPLPHKHALHQH